MKRYIKSATWSELPEDVKQNAADEYQFKRFASEAESYLKDMFPNSQLHIGHKELRYNQFSDTELEVYGILYVYDMINVLWKNNLLISKEYDILSYCFYEHDVKNYAKEIVSEGWNKLLLNYNYKSTLLSYINSIILYVEDGYGVYYFEYSNEDLEETLYKFVDLVDDELTMLEENFTSRFINGKNPMF